MIMTLGPSCSKANTGENEIKFHLEHNDNHSFRQNARRMPARKDALLLAL